MGNHDLKKRDQYEYSYRVDHVILHPDFRKNGPYSNDIALIKVRANTGNHVMFNSHVQPICLPKHRGITRPGAWCSVTGWGAQNGNHSFLQLSPFIPLPPPPQTKHPINK